MLISLNEVERSIDKAVRDGTCSCEKLGVMKSEVVAWCRGVAGVAARLK